MRRLWAWYLLWTAADVATTIYLHHTDAGSELNPLINTLTSLVGFDVATIITALTMTLLLLPLLRHPLFVPAAKSIMAVKFVAPLNNMLLIVTGLSLIDVFMLTTSLDAYQAYFLLILMANAPAIIYFYKRAPRPPPNFSISSAAWKRKEIDNASRSKGKGAKD